LEGWIKALKKPSNPAQYPQAARDIWNAFMNKSAEDKLLKAHEYDFAVYYLYKVMDESSWNVNSTLATSGIKTWQGMQKPHLYVWFIFEATKSGSQAKILDAQKFGRLFDILKFYNAREKIETARSATILLTDAKGFY